MLGDNDDENIDGKSGKDNTDVKYTTVRMIVEEVTATVVIMEVRKSIHYSEIIPPHPHQRCKY